MNYERPEFITCNASFYEVFVRELGIAIWEREFERARKQLMNATAELLRSPRGPLKPRGL